MADEIRATPQSPIAGAIARKLRSLQELAARYEVDKRIPLFGGTSVDELLSLPGAASLAEDISYDGLRRLIRGGNAATGGIGTYRLDPRVADLADVAGAAGSLAGLGAKAAKPVGKLAAEGIARAVERGSPLTALAQPMHVIKPKGGNWVAGADSPEEAVRPLRTTIVGMEPAERIPVVEDVIRQYEAAGEGAAPFAERMRADKQRLTGEAALNTWIDQKLAKYIRNEMGTPEDPLRALIQERGVSHLPLEALQQAAGWIPDEVALARKRAGFPELGLVEEGSGQMYGDLSELQRAASGWETAADMLIRGERAGDLMRMGEGSPTVRANLWLAKVPPETPVYSFKGFGEADLGFSHLIDELRNAVMVQRYGGLPRELQLRPEQLSKVTMPQAVELVAKINNWRAAQAAAAQRAAREGIPVHKEYPEGYRWLAAPDTAFDPRGLKYVQDVGCEGGWCTQSEVMAQRYGGGGRQLFVLHDPEGLAVAQVAVKPSGMSPYDAWYRSQKVGSPELQEFERYLNQNRDRLRDIRGEGRQGLEVWYEQWARDTGRPIVQPVPEIVEIKGKQNRAPKEEHLPFIQDFVRSGRWGRIGDIQNTGMRPTSSVFNENELRQLREAGAGDIPEALTGEDIQRLHNLIVPEGQRLKYDVRGNVIGSEGQNYASGGLVSSYDPEQIERMAAELMAD